MGCYSEVHGTDNAFGSSMISWVARWGRSRGGGKAWRGGGDKGEVEGGIYKAPTDFATMYPIVLKDIDQGSKNLSLLCLK